MKRRVFLKQIGVGSAGIMLVPSFIKCNPEIEHQNFNWDEIEQLFLNPPDSSKPWVFWMWMNGNITKEGITLDLEAMHRMGIGGAICFNTGVGIPRGLVDYASEEWFDATEHAVKEADRLGLEIMIHNSPGYSGTGGPWVTPEMSMQELVWTETQVKGLQEIAVTLPRPYAKMNYYQDVSVLAYPSLSVENGLMKDHLVKIVANGKEIDSDILTNGNPESKIRLERHDNKQSILLFEFDGPFEARSITIFRKPERPKDLFDGPRDYPPRFILEASDDGISFRRVASFGMPALRAMDTPGMQSFEAVKAKYYRLVTNDPTWISNVELHSAPRLAGWPGKSNYTHGNSDGNTPDVEEDLLIKPESVVDVTKFMDHGGQLKWKVPEKGNWTILRIGHTTTGEENAAHPDSGKGLEIDKFRREALDFQFEKFNGKLVELLKPYIGKAFIGFTTDSWEAGKQNWTKNFPQEFGKRRKYELMPWILAMTGRIVGSEDETERFLWDMRKTQSKLLAENYYGHWQQWCHKQGLQYHAEPYGDGNLDSMEDGQYLDVPMSEFWTRYIYGSDMTSKQAASIGNIYGRPVVGAEAFTGMPATSKWTDYPYSLKAEGDWFYTMGVNRLIFHTFVHQPYTTGFPGMTMGPFGTHFDRNNTWAEQAYGWINYLRRSQYLLQQGRTVADVCFFQGDSPHSGIPDIYPMMPEGIRGDVVGRDGLFSRFSIKDGKIVLPDGMTYELLVMADLDEIMPSTLKRIKELVDEGMTLVVSNKPEKDPGLFGADGEVKKLANELYGNLDGKVTTHIKHGKGQVFWGIPLEDILKSLKVSPDFLYTAENQDATIHYLHKKLMDGEFYFISNHRRRNEKINISLRSSRMVPELWDGETGERVLAPIFQSEGGRLEMPLELSPAGSVFIILRKKAEKGMLRQVSKDGVVLFRIRKYPTPIAAKYAKVINNFSISLWVKPDTYAHGGRSMLFHPSEGNVVYGEGHAVCGLGAGQNGVFVYERAGKRARNVLTFNGPLQGWTHLVLIFRNGIPELYVNATRVAVGDSSGLKVHPGLETPKAEEQFNSYFEGNYTQPELHNTVLSVNEIGKLYQKGLPSLHLIAPLSMEDDTKGQKRICFTQNGNYELEYNSGVKENIPVNECRNLDMNENWTIEFPERSGAPARIGMEKIQSLINYPDFSIQHFSGTCNYHKTMQLDAGLFTEGRRFLLDLGRVEVISRVLLNGKDAGIYWKEPFVADITEFVQIGENKLQIEVTTLWPNRLIGDEYLPAENEYSKDHFILKLPEWYTQNRPKPGERISFCVWQNMKKTDPLLESGLLGPVKLICGVEKSV